MAIGRDHRHRFEQTVEGRGAGPQQGVAHRRKAQLLGPVFRDQDQPAIGQRLRHDPQMRAVGQRPGLFLRSAGGEPARAFAPPFGEVARFGHPASIAGFIEQPLELRRGDQHGRFEREDPLERRVGKGQLARGIELRDPSAELIEHRPLR